MLITQNWVTRLLNQHNPEWAVSPAEYQWAGGLFDCLIAFGFESNADVTTVEVGRADGPFRIVLVQ